jgi:predicted RNA binding protein YcfA (HicA-like mRNA interferase family)
MGQGFYDILKQLLLNNGCEFIRQGKGSHEYWKSTLNGKCFSVPVTVKSRHTANGILKQAGIDKKI